MRNKITLFLIIFLFPILIKSQIGLTFLTEIDGKSAIVSIQNNSSENYAFPIEMTNVKPYYENDNVCEYFIQYHPAWHSLSLSLKLTDVTTGEILEPQNTHVSIDYDQLYKCLKENDSTLSEENIGNWQTKYKIVDKEKAKLNYYIYNNLILLKPGQIIRFRVLIDTTNISTELYFIKRYDIKPDTKYLYQLYTEIADCTYDSLTPEQKKELKDYNLFKGKVSSNAFYSPSCFNFK